MAPLSSRVAHPADANASIHSNAATVGALVAATVHSLHRHGSRRAAEALPGEGPALQEHAGPRRPQTGQHDGCAGRQSARGGLGVLFGAGCEVALTSLSTLRGAHVWANTRQRWRPALPRSGRPEARRALHQIKGDVREAAAWERAQGQAVGASSTMARRPEATGRRGSLPTHCGAGTQATAPRRCVDAR